MTKQTIRLDDIDDIGVLREFAQNVLGIDVPKTANGALVKAKIREANGGIDTIEIDVPDAVAPLAGHAPFAPSQAAAGPKPGHVRILLHKNEEDTEERHLPVSVNGRAMLIPKGVECDIPFHYFHALLNAQKAIYRMENDNQMSSVPTMVPAYPFSVIARGPEIPGWAESDNGRGGSHQRAA